MIYDKIINDNGMYLYTDNNLNTIRIQLYFNYENNTNNEPKEILLQNYLETTNKIYKNEAKINIKKSELYDLQVNFYDTEIGSKKLFCYDVDLVSFDAINDDYSKEAYKFIYNMLYKPNFKDKRAFEYIKKITINSIEYSLQDPNEIATRLYNLNVYDNNKETFNNSRNIDYIKDEIDKVQLSDLEELYNKIINNFYRGIVFGNISEKEFKEFRKYFPQTNNKLLDYNTNKINNESSIEISKDTMHESIVYVTYEYKKTKKEILNLLESMLSGDDGFCNNILREKYGLIYSSETFFDYYDRLLIFQAKIDKRNKEKLLKAINEIIDSLTNKEEIKKYLELSKKIEKQNNYIINENKESLMLELYNYVFNLYENYNYENYINNIDNYTEKDINDMAKTLKLKNVIMYRGDNNEEL